MIKELEIQVWEALKAKDKEAYLALVDKDAVMVCGGYRCLGNEYAEFINDFDLADYEILNYEDIVSSDDLCQIHYVIRTHVSDSANADLEGIFHITSTWRKANNSWKLIFNMDSRIIEE